MLCVIHWLAFGIHIVSDVPVDSALVVPGRGGEGRGGEGRGGEEGRGGRGGEGRGGEGRGGEG